MSQEKNEEKIGSSPRITVTRYAKKIENDLVELNNLLNNKASNTIITYV